MTSSPARPSPSSSGASSRSRSSPSKPVSAEIEAGGVQRVQLGRQQLVIPARELGQPVVGDPVGAHLLRRQVRQPDDRHLGETQVVRRQQPAVAGDDLAVVRTITGTVQPYSTIEAAIFAT